MTKMLLAFNGAEYSEQAIKKAIWLAIADGAQLDVLYISPPCNQLYPDVPGLCFWMPEWEYKIVSDRLKVRLLDEKIIPHFQEAGLEPRIIVSNSNQDEKIKEISIEHPYDKIFIASPSKYCQQKKPGRLWFKNKIRDVPCGTVCLI